MINLTQKEESDNAKNQELLSELDMLTQVMHLTYNCFLLKFYKKLEINLGMHQSLVSNQRTAERP